MNILVYSRRLQLGGAEKVIAALTFVWKRLGHKVVLVTHPPEGGFEFPFACEERVSVGDWCDADVVALHGRYWFDCAVINDAWNTDECRRVIAGLRALSIAVILINHHAFNNWCFSLSNSGDASNSPVSAPLDCMVCVSSVQALWWRLRGYRSILIRNPVLLPGSCPLRDDDGRTLIWVGRPTDSTKRVPLLMRLFQAIAERNEDARLLLLGDCPERFKDKLLAEVADNVRSRIVFAGRVSDVVERMASAAVQLHTSLWEVSPQVFEEARSVGLPTVTFNLPIFDSMGANDGMVRVESEREYVDEVLSLLQDSAKRRRIGNEGRAFAKSVNDPHALAVSWEALFSAIQNKNLDAYAEECTTNIMTLRNCKNTIIEIQRSIGVFGDRHMPVLLAPTVRDRARALIRRLMAPVLRERR